jgi:hypothetical protein
MEPNKEFSPKTPKPFTASHDQLESSTVDQPKL